jgi:hypothetical protein
VVRSGEDPLEVIFGVEDEGRLDFEGRKQPQVFGDLARFPKRSAQPLDGLVK